MTKMLKIVVMPLLAMRAFAAQVVVDYRAVPDARPENGQNLMRAVSQEDGLLRRTSIPASEAQRLETALQVGDELTLMLFDDKVINLKLVEKATSPLGGESFLAAVTGYEGIRNAVVVQTADGLQIDVQDYLQSKVYSVYSTKSGVVVKEVRPTRRPCKCGSPLSAQAAAAYASESALPQLSKMKSYQSRSAEAPGETFVDLLIVYDKLASDWVSANGGATNFAEITVQKMNVALANTGLDSHFRFRLVGVREVEGAGAKGYEDGRTLDQILDSIAQRSELNGYNWGVVKDMRDEVEADVVCVLTDTGFSYGTTGSGFSFKPETASVFSGSAFNCCAIRAVSEGHTMTHEVGHNMGAGHSDAMADKDNCGPQYYPYSSGFYFYVGETGYNTIMGYNFDGYGNSYTEVPYFSSPDYFYEGVPLGDELHDNSRTIKNNFLVVSRFRGSWVDASSVGAAIDADDHTWETDYNFPWTVITDASSRGSSAARSCEMDGETISWLRTEVDGPVNMSFDYQMRTHGGCFRVVCDSEVLFERKEEDISSTSWTTASVAIPDGRHVVKFSYEQSEDVYVDGWGNGVRLDRVAFEKESHVRKLYGRGQTVIAAGEIAPYEKTATVYDGFLVDETGAMKGTVQVKVAKGKTDRKSGSFSAKVSATVQMADGSKKLSFKNGVANETGAVTSMSVSGHALDVSLGVYGLGGTFDGKYSIDGARNLFTAKDKSEKERVEAIAKDLIGSVNVILPAGQGALSVSIAAKGKVKVSGTVNGAKVTATSQLLVGEEACCVPVVITKKANLAFSLWLKGGKVEIVGLEGVVAGKAETLKAGAAFCFPDGAATLLDRLPDSKDEYLPGGLSVVQSGSKWVVADGAKAGKLVLKKGTTEVDETKSKFTDNMSGLKLTYKSKDGSFTGSFKAYAVEKGKLKTYTLNVTGVMVGSVGYGTATLKKLSVSLPITVE